MLIVTDTREQCPLDFSPYPCTVEVGTLPLGDYSVKDLEHLMAIERKSIPDLVASVTRERERFERELSRSRGHDLFAVVIEGSLEEVRQHLYRSKAKPHAVLQSMVAFQVRYGVNWTWAGSPAGAAYFTYWTFSKYIAEAKKRFQAIVRATAASTPEHSREAS